MAARFPSTMVTMACLAVLLPLITVQAAAGNGPAKPGPYFGVQTDQKHAYSPRNDQGFQCNDGKLTIPWDRVNDDYCDCADGSDEPGTSACPNGRFFCLNKGAVGLSLPSSRVNDGICDCCDGSDEKFARQQCENTCLHASQHMIADLKKEAAIHTEGTQKRNELTAQGRQLIDSKRARLAEIQQQKEGIQSRLVQAEANRNAQKASVDQLQTDWNNDVEQLRSAHIAQHGVPEPDASQQQEAQQADEQADANNAQEDIAQPPPEFKEPEEPEGLQNAKQQLAELEKTVTSIQAENDDLSNEVNGIETFVSRQPLDGEQGWLALSEEHVSLQYKGYTYDITPLDRAKQVDQGGRSVSIGTFSSWENKDGFPVMQFRDGVRCWQGPARSLDVTIKCGLETEIVEVEEPSICTYTAIMKTPLACSLDVARAKNEAVQALLDSQNEVQ